MPVETKCTKAEFAERVETVKKMILHNLSNTEIKRYVKDKTNWDICDRQVDTYVIEAKKELRKIFENFDRELEVAESVQKYRDIYKACMRINDYKQALRAQRAIERIMCLTDVANNKYRSKGRLPRMATIEEIESEILKIHYAYARGNLRQQKALQMIQTLERKVERKTTNDEVVRLSEDIQKLKEVLMQDENTEPGDAPAGTGKYINKD